MENGTQWEYRIVPVSIGSGVNKYLNELGRMGWELVAVDTVPASDAINAPKTNAYFKRPLGSDPSRVGVVAR